MTDIALTVPSLPYTPRNNGEPSPETGEELLTRWLQEMYHMESDGVNQENIFKVWQHIIDVRPLLTHKQIETLIKYIAPEPWGLKNYLRTTYKVDQFSAASMTAKGTRGAATFVRNAGL